MLDPTPEHQENMQNNIKNDLVRYFSETTVHGFRYVVQGRNLLERSVWILFISFGFCYSGYSIYNAYNYWENHPVETTIDEIGLPVHELYFPAITVCDTESLTMPRRNRWMFVEQLLNSVELLHPEEVAKHMYPGDYCNQNIILLNI